MSVLPDDRGVRCDGSECHATALLPVALRRTLSHDPLPESSNTSIRGWLFAGSSGSSGSLGSVKHFCPRCLPFYLPQALDGVIRALPETVLGGEETANQDDTE